MRHFRFLNYINTYISLLVYEQSSDLKQLTQFQKKGLENMKLQRNSNSRPLPVELLYREGYKVLTPQNKTKG